MANCNDDVAVPHVLEEEGIFAHEYYTHAGTQEVTHIRTFCTKFSLPMHILNRKHEAGGTQPKKKKSTELRTSELQEQELHKS